ARLRRHVAHRHDLGRTGSGGARGQHDPGADRHQPAAEGGGGGRLFVRGAARPPAAAGARPRRPQQRGTAAGRRNPHAGAAQPFARRPPFAENNWVIAAWLQQGAAPTAGSGFLDWLAALAARPGVVETLLALLAVGIAVLVWLRLLRIVEGVRSRAAL